MDVLTNDEIDDLVNASDLAEKYNKEIDKESAYEILTKRMEQAVAAEQEVEQEKSTARQPKEEPSVFEQVLKSRAGRTFTTTLAREGAKFVLGMFGLKMRR
jgi:hypothetical protein